MRNSELIVGLTFAALLTPAAPAEEQTDQTPEKLIEQWAAAYNKNDPALLLAFYEQSEDVDVIISAGIRHHGFKAVRNAYTDDFKAVRFHDSKAINLSSRIIDNTALVTFEHQFKSRVVEDNSRWRIHVRPTSVLKRVKGTWKIVLEHSSPIRGTERVVPIEE